MQCNHCQPIIFATTVFPSELFQEHQSTTAPHLPWRRPTDKNSQLYYNTDNVIPNQM